jgi:hypothetical protein
VIFVPRRGLAVRALDERALDVIRRGAERIVEVSEGSWRLTRRNSRKSSPNKDPGPEGEDQDAREGHQQGGVQD